MIPPAIIFINAEINSITQSTLVTQLFIDEVINGAEFDERVDLTPLYTNIVHLQGKRILVIRSDYYDQTNRSLADVALFISHGMATVEKNNFGPPGLSIPIDRIDLYTLLRDVGSKNVTIL